MQEQLPEKVGMRVKKYETSVRDKLIIKNRTNEISGANQK